MTTGIRGVLDAMVGVGLLIAVHSGTAFASPVLGNPTEDPPAASQPLEEQPAETRPIPTHARARLPTPELAEIRADESASWRNFIPELTHAPAPSQRRNAAPSEVEAQLKQLFRQLSLLFADSAGVPVFVRERTRWDAAMAVAAGEIHFLGFGSAMARDPLAHAPQANAATFPSGGYEEFTFTPIGGRRAYQPEADAQQPPYGSGYGGAPANNDYSSARTTAAAAQWSTPPQGAGGAAEHLTPFIDSFRDVLTDPVTIIVAFGWLMLWLFLETVQWGPGRRRRRG